MLEMYPLTKTQWVFELQWHLRQWFPKHAFGTSDERLHISRIESTTSPRRCLIEELFSSTIIPIVQGPSHLTRERQDIALDLLGGFPDLHGISFHFGQTLHCGSMLFCLGQESLAFLEGRPGPGACREETPNAGQTGIVFLKVARKIDDGENKTRNQIKRTGQNAIQRCDWK